MQLKYLGTDSKTIHFKCLTSAQIYTYSTSLSISEGKWVKPYVINNRWDFEIAISLTPYQGLKRRCGVDRGSSFSYDNSQD